VRETAGSRLSEKWHTKNRVSKVKANVILRCVTKATPIPVHREKNYAQGDLSVTFAFRQDDISKVVWHFRIMQDIPMAQKCIVD